MSPTAAVVGAVIGKIPGEQYQRISIFVPPAALIRTNTVIVSVCLCNISGNCVILIPQLFSYILQLTRAPS